MTPQKHLPAPSLFRSFWLGGFEASSHINGARVRLDMLAATQHDRQAAQDYALLRSMGIQAARDGIRWHLIDRNGTFDFSSLAPMVKAAREHGIQVIWDLCHYGWPDDIDLLSPTFVDRYARFCSAVARFLADHSDEAPFYTPMNEISFVAFAVGRGIMHPFISGRDDEIKHQLVRAAIAGTEAVWAVNPLARIVHGDPVINVIAPRNHPKQARAAARARASQYESWDMLAGRIHSELGGNPRHLDIVGVNFYHANQWEHGGSRLRWEDTRRDERWMPFHQLLAEVYARYQRPLFIGETSHFGAGRARWIRENAAEVLEARSIGVPVEGICLYPIIDRPDWDNPLHWHHSGLWDLVPNGDGELKRVLNSEYATELVFAQQRLAGI